MRLPTIIYTLSLGLGLLAGCPGDDDGDDDAAVTESSTGASSTGDSSSGSGSGGPITATTLPPTTGTTGDDSGTADSGSTSAAETGTGDSPGSCTRLNEDQCLDYTGEDWTAMIAMAGCPAGDPDVQYSPDPCPTDGIVLSCVFFIGDSTESVGHYYPDWTTKDATSDCNVAGGVPQ